MAGTINDFRSSFKVDVARPSRFDVTIPVPYYMLTQYNNAKQLQMRCESAELPGRTFATADRKMGSVPVQKYPYQSTYNDVSLTFIVSDDMSEKIFFDTWMEVINPTMHFNFKYRADYSVDISISQYDVTNDVTYVSTLIDAYPISVNQLNMDWSAMDSYHKLAVVFAYSYWENTTVQGVINNIETQILSGLGDTINTILS